MIFEKNDKIVMIGDSITDAGRARPIGEGRGAAYGTGYVNVVKGLLDCSYPELNLRLITMGCSGNTVKDLKERWETDVMDLKPDYLSIMIGINDVWRQFDCPLQVERHVHLDEYEATLDSLIVETLPILKGLILMTPYYIESNKSDAMRAKMDEYGEVVKKLAVKHNTMFVDTQAAINRILEHCHSSALSWDRVHPNISGHTVLAKAFLQTVGFEF